MAVVLLSTPIQLILRIRHEAYRQVGRGLQCGCVGIKNAPVGPGIFPVDFYCFGFLFTITALPILPVDKLL